MVAQARTPDYNARVLQDAGFWSALPSGPLQVLHEPETWLVDAAAHHGRTLVQDPSPTVVLSLIDVDIDELTARTQALIRRVDTNATWVVFEAERDTSLVPDLVDTTPIANGFVRVGRRSWPRLVSIVSEPGNHSFAFKCARLWFGASSSAAKSLEESIAKFDIERKDFGPVSTLLECLSRVPDYDLKRVFDLFPNDEYPSGVLLHQVVEQSRTSFALALLELAQSGSVETRSRAWRYLRQLAPGMGAHRLFELQEPLTLPAECQVVLADALDAGEDPYSIGQILLRHG